VKIAFVTTPASVPSGIGDYARALLPHLRRHETVDVFVEERFAGPAGDRPITDLRPREYEHVLYQLGNERSHAFMAPWVRSVGGTVVLHDWVLFDLAMARFPGFLRGGLFGRGLALREGGWRELGVYARRFRERRRARADVVAGRPLADGRDASDGGSLSDDRFELPLNRSIVRFADAFLVHSDAMRERILASRNAPTPIGVVPHGAEATWCPDDRTAARTRLGLTESAFVVASFGRVQAHKRPHVLLGAVARARRVLPDLELALVGGCEPEVFDVSAALRAAELTTGVHQPGHVPAEDIATWLAAADVAVQLRGPSTGGTSGGAFRAYAAGRGVIASALDEQRELPEACTAFVQPGDGEEERLSELLVALARDPDRRVAMELAARRFVEERAHWRLVAERYVEHLERFPRARGSRRALVVLALQRARSESS